MRFVCLAGVHCRHRSASVGHHVGQRAGEGAGLVQPQHVVRRLVDRCHDAAGCAVVAGAINAGQPVGVRAGLGLEYRCEAARLRADHRGAGPGAAAPELVGDDRQGCGAVVPAQQDVVVHNLLADHRLRRRRDHHVNGAGGAVPGVGDGSIWILAIRIDGAHQEPLRADPGGLDLDVGGIDPADQRGGCPGAAAADLIEHRLQRAAHRRPADLRVLADEHRRQHRRRCSTDRSNDAAGGPVVAVAVQRDDPEAP